MVSTKFMGIAAAAGVALAASSSSSSTDLPSITIKGSKFFYPNGTEFIFKGIAYQQGVAAAGAGAINSTDGYTDPLSDDSRCAEDIPLLQQLGTNVIRTYAINPNKSHDKCMDLLAKANIYVVSDLSEPNLSINRDTPQWNVELYQRYTAVIDAMGKYSNVIGFFAGNEVSNQANNTAATAFVKAAVRDSKAYIAAKQRTSLGVGYAANDDREFVNPLASYLNCGDNSTTIDFFGYNIYSWCGATATFASSGYNDVLDFFSKYSKPVFFAEYGCNKVGGAAGRTWPDTGALYTKNMTDVISGGIVYEFFEEENDFGLVTATGSGEATKLKDFATLETAIAAAKIQGTTSSSYSPSNKDSSCPQVNSSWGANSQTLPPTPNDNACSCIASASTCVPVPDLDATKYGAIFGTICGYKASLCTDIYANGTTGTYGQYSGCNPKQQLAIVLNNYYKDQGQKSACDFKGQATIQQGSGASDCSSKQSSTGVKGSTGTNSGSGSSSGNGKDSAGVKGFALSTIAVVGALFFAL